MTIDPSKKPSTLAEEQRAERRDQTDSEWISAHPEGAAMAPETNRAALMRLYDTAELRKDTGAKRALEEAINNESVLLRLLAVQSDLNGRGHALDDLLSRCPTSASLTAIVVPIADLLPILTPFRRVLDAQ